MLLFFIAGLLTLTLYQRVQPSDEICPEFNASNDIKTLLIPNKKTDKKIIQFIDSIFNEKCSDRFLNQTLLYEGKIDAAISGKRQELALNCGADVFIQPRSGNMRDLNVNLGFVKPELRRYKVDNNAKLEAWQDSINYGKGRRSFQAKIDVAVCLITGFLLQQRGDHKDVAEELKTCNFTDADSRTRVFAFNIMADSYIEQGRYRDAIKCLQYSDTVGWQQEDRMFKIAVLAEKAEQPDIAIEYYSKLVDLNNKNRSRYLERRGDQYIKKEKFIKARSDYEKVKTIEPKNTSVIEKYEAADRKISGLDARAQTACRRTNRGGGMTLICRANTMLAMEILHVFRRALFW